VTDLSAELLEDLAVRAYADEVLGKRQAHLLRRYGRVMSGPCSGSYVSGIAPSAARAYIEAMARGEEIPVHLMHRHRSGTYESSSLQMVDGRLIMKFDDRTELA
jgi:hypothetical protein